MPCPCKSISSQDCIPVGCVPSAAVAVSEGGGSARGGGVLPRGRGGGYLPRGCTTPHVDRMTDACENITFSQLLLRTVTRMHFSRMRSIRLPSASRCIPFLGGGKYVRGHTLDIPTPWKGTGTRGVHLPTERTWS